MSESNDFVRNWLMGLALIFSIILPILTLFYYGGRALERMDILTLEVKDVKAELKTLNASALLSSSSSDRNYAELKAVESRLTTVETEVKMFTGDLKLEGEMSHGRK